MLNKLPQIENTLLLNSVDPVEIIDYINTYIDSNYCETLSIDISFLNIIDSCYVTTLCATKHFIKYPNGKINWKISSDLVQEYCKDLALNNCNYIL